MGKTPKKDADQVKGEWPFPAAAQPGDHSEKLDEGALTRGERVTDTSTKPDGGNPKAARGTYELTPDRGHDSAKAKAKTDDPRTQEDRRETLARDADDQNAQARKTQEDRR